LHRFLVLVFRDVTNNVVRSRLQASF